MTHQKRMLIIEEVTGECDEELLTKVEDYHKNDLDPQHDRKRQASIKSRPLATLADL